MPGRKLAASSNELTLLSLDSGKAGTATFRVGKDLVWPVGGERITLRTSGGTGTTLMGHTRADSSGRCFATRWFTLFGLPVVPLERYLVTRGKHTYVRGGTGSVASTAYAIHGQSRLRAGEIVRTVAFCWLLVPVLSLGPGIALFLALSASTVSDGVKALSLVGAVVWAVVGSQFLIHGLMDRYRKRWAPRRAAEWGRRPPGY